MTRSLNPLPTSVTLLFVYVLSVGGTFNALVDVNWRWLNLGVLVIAGAVWLVARRRQRWRTTPLDGVIPLWIAAILFTFITNLDFWRRSITGLWFVGIYVLLWYALHDLLARRVITRQTLVDAILLGGALNVFVGWAQVYVNVAVFESGLLRPVGTLGNPNVLAGLLIMALPFAAWRWRLARAPLTRVLLTVYLVAGLALLLLTGSRGGWLGIVGGIVIGTLAADKTRSWLFAHWRAVSRRARFAVTGIAVLIGIVSIIGLTYSFTLLGRTLDRRTFLYDTALTVMQAQPITGQGLFTFGAALSRYNSLPPEAPHSHAHNLVLHVGAELGILGITALALTAWLIWKRSRIRNDRLTQAALVAFTAFAAQQMFDIPAMMPAIAVSALITAVILTTSDEPAPAPRWSLARAVPVVWIALIISGMISTTLYGRYVAALLDGVQGFTHPQAAAELAALEALDPDNPMYASQRGFLLGTAARTDADALPEAIRAYERYVTLESFQSAGWANLAALYHQAGDGERAYTAMTQAADLAPLAWSLHYRQAIYAESLGEREAARRLYDALIARIPEVALLPEWGSTPMQAAYTISPESMNGFTQTLLRLLSGDTEGARALWNGLAARDTYSGSLFVHTLLALAENDNTNAKRYADAAAHDTQTISSQAWGALAQAVIAADETAFLQHIQRAAETLQLTPYQEDWVGGVNIAYVQWFHLAIPRQFLPQVGYIQFDVQLPLVIASSDALRQYRL